MMMMIVMRRRMIKEVMNTRMMMNKRMKRPTLAGHSQPRSSMSPPQPPFSPQLASSFTQSRIGLKERFFLSKKAWNETSFRSLPTKIKGGRCSPVAGASTKLSRHHLLHLAKSRARLGLERSFENFSIDFFSNAWLGRGLILKQPGARSVLLPSPPNTNTNTNTNTNETWSSVLAAITIPGVQNPHWLPLCLTNEVCGREEKKSVSAFWSKTFSNIQMWGDWPPLLTL